MVLAKLKKGISSIANNTFELNPGIVADIPDELFDETIMEKVESGKEIEKPKEDKVEKKIEKEPEKKIEKPKSFKEELIDLPGIGPKIADQILSMAKTKEGFSKISRKTLIDELPDDKVTILDKYLGR